MESKLLQIEAERKKGHEWIDSAPEPVLRALANGSLLDQSGPLAFQDTTRVTLYEPMKAIIDCIDDPQERITSAIMYDALLQAIPSLEYENEWKLKARIAATLGRLVDEKVLKMAKIGRGASPHIYVVRPSYRAAIDEARKKRGNRNEPAAATTGPPASSPSDKEDIL
ncbi:MAG: hypothetical protein AABN34_11375 [Acidobacteriota bacterium]